MKRVKKPKIFLLGLTLSLLVTVIVWYWYKSTAAEEGALDLLDRMGGTEARLRQAQAMIKERDLPAQYITLERNGTVHVKMAAAPNDLERVKGIGPVFAARLQATGVHTIAELAALTADQVAVILDIPESRAEAVLAEAKRSV